MKLLYLECSMWPHRKFITKMRHLVNYETIWKRYQENNCFQSALVWCWGGLGRDCHSSPGDCNCNNLHHCCHYCCPCRHSNDYQHPFPVSVIIFAIAVTIVFVFVNSLAMVVIPVIVMLINIIIVIVVTTCPMWSEKRVGLLDKLWGMTKSQFFSKTKTMKTFYLCSWSNLFCGSGWTS